MKVFIVSSSRAVSLAKRVMYRLNQEFTQNKEFDCDVWCSETFKPGEYTLESLIRKCRSSDFVVVFLTKDDHLTKKHINVFAPRDNCVFELGLFLGGLMFDRERCIILSSVESHALPSDVAGVTIIPFDEPEDLNTADDDILDKAVKGKVTEIANSIKTRGSLQRLELSPQTLLQLEKLDIYRGSLKPSAMVTVKAAQPLELKRNSDFASQAQKNFEASIKYRYFFHYYDNENLWLIATLIQNLASVGVTGDVPAAVKQNMRDFKEKVLDNFTRMKRCISIDLVSKMVPLEFCVHNASSARDAICYLRLPNGNFIKCSESQPAYEIAKDLMRVNPLPPDMRPVFAKSLDKDLKLPGIRVELQTKLRTFFDPSFHKILDEVCFEA